MKTRHILLTLVVSCFLHAQGFVKDEVIVRWKDSTNKSSLEVKELLHNLELKLKKHMKFKNLGFEVDVFSSKNSDIKIEDTIKALEDSGLVKYAEKNYKRKPFNTDSQTLDEKYPSVSSTIDDGIWYMENIGLDQVWEKYTKHIPSDFQSDVVVGILDNSFAGILNKEKELKKNIWVNENEIPNNDIDDDNNGYIDDVYGFDGAKNKAFSKNHLESISPNHGILVTSMISTELNSSKFIGNGQNLVKSAICSVGSRYYITDEIPCMEYFLALKRNGVNIKAINASYGGYGEDNELEKEAIEVLNSEGILFVASSGNENIYNNLHKNTMAYPAGLDLDGIISVGGVANEDEPFFNYGHSVDIAAPAFDWDHLDIAGTSFAAPLVTGTIGYLASYAQYLNQYENKDINITSKCLKELVLDNPNYLNNFNQMNQSNGILSMINATDSLVSGYIVKLNIDNLDIFVDQKQSFDFSIKKVCSENSVDSDDILNITWTNISENEILSNEKKFDYIFTKEGIKNINLTIELSNGATISKEFNLNVSSIVKKARFLFTFITWIHNGFAVSSDFSKLAIDYEVDYDYHLDIIDFPYEKTKKQGSLKTSTKAFYRSLLFSSDNKYLFGIQYNNVVEKTKIFSIDSSTNKPTLIKEFRDKGALALKISEDGRYLFSQGKKSTSVYDIADINNISKVTTLEGGHISPNGKYLISKGDIWDISDIYNPVKYLSINNKRLEDGHIYRTKKGKEYFIVHHNHWSSSKDAIYIYDITNKKEPLLVHKMFEGNDVKIAMEINGKLYIHNKDDKKLVAYDLTEDITNPQEVYSLNLDNLETYKGFDFDYNFRVSEDGKRLMQVSQRDYISPIIVYDIAPRQLVDIGDDGENLIKGSKGDDTLIGKGGIDTYIIDNADGSDRIVEEKISMNIIEFIGDTTQDDLTFEKVGDDLVVRYSDTDSLVLDGYNTNFEIHFANGTVLDADSFKKLVDSKVVLYTFDDKKVTIASTEVFNMKGTIRKVLNKDNETLFVLSSRKRKLYLTTFSLKNNSLLDEIAFKPLVFSRSSTRVTAPTLYDEKAIDMSFFKDNQIAVLFTNLSSKDKYKRIYRNGRYRYTGYSITEYESGISLIDTSKPSSLKFDKSFVVSNLLAREIRGLGDSLVLSNKSNIDYILDTKIPYYKKSYQNKYFELELKELFSIKNNLPENLEFNQDIVNLKAGWNYIGLDHEYLSLIDVKNKTNNAVRALYRCEPQSCRFTKEIVAHKAYQIYTRKDTSFVYEKKFKGGEHILELGKGNNFVNPPHSNMTLKQLKKQLGKDNLQSIKLKIGSKWKELYNIKNRKNSFKNFQEPYSYYINIKEAASLKF
jgi:hypothetical protein